MPYLIAIALIIIAGVVYLFLYDNNASESPVVDVSTQGSTTDVTSGEKIKVPTSPTPTPTTPANGYKDGTYETSVTYLTPVRSQYKLDVTFTVAKDVITAADVAYSQGAEKDPNAAKFEAAYKAQVIGKDIDSLNLSRVGGASLTTGAFNNALVAIKTDAKS